MLVLTRKPGECIVVADVIVIKVLGVNGHQVRIGIEAPQSVVVDRQEVYEKKKNQRMHKLANNDEQLHQVVFEVAN